MQQYKVGSLIRHVHESSEWIWKVTKLPEGQHNYAEVILTKDVYGTNRLYPKGYYCTIHKDMVVVIKNPIYKPYYPEWL